MATQYKCICDRCKSHRIEARGNVCDDSFDAAMNPYRVFVSKGVYKLWCDDCIEEHAYYCPNCCNDYNVAEHYYSKAYAASLGGKCPLCGLPFDIHTKTAPRAARKTDAPQSVKQKRAKERREPLDARQEEPIIPVPLSPVQFVPVHFTPAVPVFTPVPPVINTNVQLAFRSPK